MRKDKTLILPREYFIITLGKILCPSVAPRDLIDFPTGDNVTNTPLVYNILLLF